MMAAYGMTYFEVGGLPATKFEELWHAYAIRTSLDRLDREYDRQRTTLQSGMGEPDKVKAALEELHEAYLYERERISSGEAFKPDEPQYDTEIWWKKDD